MGNQDLAINGGSPVRTIKDKRQYTIGEEEKAMVMKVMENGILSAFRGGEFVREFENKFSDFCGCKYGIATTSGTTALHTAVSALGLKPGDEVIVPAYTFVSTASVVIQENATPVFADIDESFNLDMADVKRKITPKTKAVIVVHLFGNPANMEELMKVARDKSLVVIEDCAQAHGAILNNKKAGSFGDFGCFSFFQTKNMTCGEGGMVITNDSVLYSKAKRKREHGSLDIPGGSWYNYEELGYNYNMTEMQAAVGLAQLDKLPRFNEKRIENGKRYRKLLADTNLLFIKDNGVNVYHNFPILIPAELSPKRDEIVSAIRAEGVWVDVCYPKALYQTNLFINMGIKGDCPMTENVASRMITAFTDPLVSKDYIEDTCKAIKKCISYFLKND
jgi:perosamine synthetase